MYTKKYTTNFKIFKHDILISLYRKEPEVLGNEEKTKFNLEINKKLKIYILNNIKLHLTMNFI